MQSKSVISCTLALYSTPVQTMYNLGSVHGKSFINRGFNPVQPLTLYNLAMYRVKSHDFKYFGVYTLYPPIRGHAPNVLGNILGASPGFSPAWQRKCLKELNLKSRAIVMVFIFCLSMA